MQPLSDIQYQIDLSQTKKILLQKQKQIKRLKHKLISIQNQFQLEIKELKKRCQGLEKDGMEKSQIIQQFAEKYKKECEKGYLLEQIVKQVQEELQISKKIKDKKIKQQIINQSKRIEELQTQNKKLSQQKQSLIIINQSSQQQQIIQQTKKTTQLQLQNKTLTQKNKQLQKILKQNQKLINSLLTQQSKIQKNKNMMSQIHIMKRQQEIDIKQQDFSNNHNHDFKDKLLQQKQEKIRLLQKQLKQKQDENIRLVTEISKLDGILEDLKRNGFCGGQEGYEKTRQQLQVSDMINGKDYKSKKTGEKDLVAVAVTKFNSKIQQERIDFNDINDSRFNKNLGFAA